MLHWHAGPPQPFVFVQHGTEVPKEKVVNANTIRMRAARAKLQLREVAAAARLLHLEATVLALRVKCEKLEAQIKKKSAKRGFGASGCPIRYPAPWSTTRRPPLKPCIVHIRKGSLVSKVGPLRDYIVEHYCCRASAGAAYRNPCSSRERDDRGAMCATSDSRWNWMTHATVQQMLRADASDLVCAYVREVAAALDGLVPREGTKDQKGKGVIFIDTGDCFADRSKTCKLDPHFDWDNCRGTSWVLILFLQDDCIGFPQANAKEP